MKAFSVWRSTLAFGVGQRLALGVELRKRRQQVVTGCPESQQVTLCLKQLATVSCHDRANRTLRQTPNAERRTPCNVERLSHANS